MYALFVHAANKVDSLRNQKDSNKTWLEDLKSLQFWRAVFAEWLGTMLLVFLGCGSILTFSPNHIPSLEKISLAFGLSVASIVQIIGHISGCHINPAVSIAMMVSMDISPIRGSFYVVAQCLGGIVGSALLYGVTPDDMKGTLGATQLDGALSAGQGFGVEFILTFVLVITIYATVDPDRPSFGNPSVSIGFVVTAANLAGIRFTGCGINPARSLGPAVVANVWGHHWIYWAGPIIGGIVAALLYKYVLCPYRSILSIDQVVTRLVEEDNILKNLCISGKQANQGNTVSPGHG